MVSTDLVQSHTSDCLEHIAGPLLILGNVNTGKSTLFERLVGGHWIEESDDGVTLRRGVMHRCGHRRGCCRHGVPSNPQCFVVYDTPGTATLLPQDDVEAAVRDAILRLNPSALLIVADAKNVRRSLALTLHAAELGLPMILAVNMNDEATRRGIGVDTERIARALGIDVVATTASEGEGVEELRQAVLRPRVPRSIVAYPPYIDQALNDLEELVVGSSVLPCAPRGLALLLLGDDEVATALIERELGGEAVEACSRIVEVAREGARRPLGIAITDHLYEMAEKLAKDAVKSSRHAKSIMDRFGELAEHRIWGLIIAIAVVIAMYYWVGALGATIVVDLLNERFFTGLLTPLCERAVAPIPWEIVRDAIMDEDFGLLPTGLFLAFGIVLPVLFFFFFAFGILQSSGYLARLSVLLDKLFRRFGLNGRGVMPIVMGFSCVTMALITTRMLETRRERIIASFLILGLPCAPLFAVLMVILGEMPVSAAIVVFGVLTLQKLIAGVFAARLLPGRSPDFIMVIPPMRLPKIGHVFVQTTQQTYAFMKEAVPLFLLASFLLFVFDRIGGLALMEWLAHPITHGLLQLPDQAVQVFIKSLVRRETGATELTLVQSHFSNLQLVVTLLVMSTIVPCVNAAIVLFKERGARVASATIAAVMVYSLIVGGLVSHVCTWLGVTFT